MLRGKPWGWWLLGVHALFGVFRHGRALVHLLMNPALFAVRTPFEAGLYALAFCALIGFWLSARLRRWCNTQSVAWANAVVVASLVVALIVGTFTLLS